MEPLLTPVNTSTGTARHDPESVIDVIPDHQERTITANETIDDAILILKSKPSLETLRSTLSWLESCFPKEDASNIKVPNSKSAQVIHVLVHEILPSYWSILRDTRSSSHSNVRRSLVRCLSTIHGIGIVVNRLSLLLKDREVQAGPLKSGKKEEVEDICSLLALILEKNSIVYHIYFDLGSLVSDSSKRSLLWKETCSLLATGRILALAAQAEDINRDTGASLRVECWLANGPRYAAWLGNNIEYMLRHFVDTSDENWKQAAQILSKSLTLGYTDKIIEALFSSPLAGDGRKFSIYRQVIDRLTPNETRNVLNSMLRIVSKRLQTPENNGNEAKVRDRGSKVLQGVSGLISVLALDHNEVKDQLCQWLVSSVAASAGQGIAVHRAVIATLAMDKGQLKTVFEKVLALFSDKLYIKHAPILQQEVNTQILLIVAGYLHRGDDQYLSLQTRSSTYINAISNRLSASSPRACVLGMLVGTAISELVDAEGKRMKFSSEEVDNAEGRWYRSLVTIQDTVGSIEDLKTNNHAMNNFPAKKQIAMSTRSSDSPSTRNEQASRIIAIEEIGDDMEAEDDDLMTYEKPDSDLSDEDEDPTLIQRDRPTPPVYIRDLISGLRDTENFDRQKLALSHASALIRRKANFGSEVSEHIEELATLLVGLGDKYNMEDFQQMRLRGMIAVLIAQPLKMAQWFSTTFFNGDYSIGQRASVLTTLGLGARELAGLHKEDSSITGADAPSGNFPSKMLPEKLHKIYAIEAKPVNAISAQLEKSMIKLMAVDAAEELAGPSALKVRTFSSRMTVEKKRERPIANSLATIVAEGFLFPLMGLWRTHAQACGEQTVHSSPFLLALYLKTLSLIFHASGSSTLSLPQMTAEFWDLLLSLRSYAADLPVLEALLFALLTLLDINGNNQRRIAEGHAKELLETQEWVQLVFAKVGGGSAEGERARMLAAGVLTRTQEIVGTHQRMLLGDLSNYM